jgi:hypothetical protein
MMNTDVKQLIDWGDKLFTDRQSLTSLWQEIADNFYVERADFTVTRTVGTDFAEHLLTSYPLLARRDLGNSFSSILRPSAKEWFQQTAEGVENDHEAKAWLEWATKVQRRAMYDVRSQFVRATKEGDHDYAAFGQCAISVELNRNADGLLYRCWHLRDAVWCENQDGEIDQFHLKWKPTVLELSKMFPGRLSQGAQQQLQKDPYCRITCRRIVVPSDMYRGEKGFRTPFVSVIVDVDNMHVMEEVGQRTFPYVVPRWQTVSGSQYAYSPATVCALPDARLIQDMTRVLLEAGEKATNPPMLAVQEAIRGDVSIYAGGITWVDREYDERLGEVLRPLSQDKTGIPLGLDMRNDVRATIMEAFYLNKLSLPMMAGNMTATEVSQRVQEYIRQALPLFEPMEQDYNGALCERTFDLLLYSGAYGPLDSIPRGLSRKDVRFRFESPLSEAADRQKGQTFLEAAGLLAQAAAIDPGAPAILDAKETMRDVLRGIGVPTKWTRSPEMVRDMEEQQAAAAMAQQQMAMLGQGAQIAKTAAEAAAL